jgi:hypothetical protein
VTDSERALRYIEIFANAGGEFVGDDRFRIGAVEVGPGEDDMWFLDDGRWVQWFRKAVAS